MKLADTVELSLRNLRQAKLRTGLTMLGVSIGIASLAGMVSLGVGLQDQVVGRFMQAGVFGTITVTGFDIGGPLAQLGRRGGAPGRGVFRGRGATAETQQPSKKLDEAALREIAGIENVREAYANLIVPLEMTLGDYSRPVQAVGVPMSSKDEGVFQTFAYGRFFNSDSDKACMLSSDMAKRLAEDDPKSLVGKSLTLSYAARSHGDESAAVAGFAVRRVDLPCPIVGVVERNPGPGLPGGAGVLVSGLMIPMAMAKAIDSEIVTNAESLIANAVGPRPYASVTVKVKQPRFTQDVEDRIRQMGYAAISVDDALKGAKNAFLILDIFLSLIGSIALAVSSLGIVNTMVMSILERTRDIGIMKAIGASDNDIRRIFLIEAATIGLFGGFAGVTLGWIVGRIINIGANLYIVSQGGTPGTLFSLPLWLIASAIAFSVAVSLAAGSYPATRAARLDPIQALRHD